jgi:hypothetical protein
MASDNDKIFYSGSKRGFFHSILNKGAIPGDAVEITQDQWQALLEAQANGQEIVPDANGQPIASDPAVTTDMLKTRILTIESQQGRAKQ